MSLLNHRLKQRHRAKTAARRRRLICEQLETRSLLHGMSLFTYEYFQDDVAQFYMFEGESVYYSSASSDCDHDAVTDKKRPIAEGEESAPSGPAGGGPLGNDIRPGGQQSSGSLTPGLNSRPTGQGIGLPLGNDNDPRGVSGRTQDNVGGLSGRPVSPQSDRGNSIDAPGNKIADRSLDTRLVNGASSSLTIPVPTPLGSNTGLASTQVRTPTLPELNAPLVGLLALTGSRGASEFASNASSNFSSIANDLRASAHRAAANRWAVFSLAVTCNRRPVTSPRM